MTVKDRVLEALEAHRGEYFSGEGLAGELQVSRSAVWKAISQLRESGYPIEAAPNRGYRLAQDSTMLSAQSIARYCSVPGLWRIRCMWPPATGAALPAARHSADLR